MLRNGKKSCLLLLLLYISIHNFCYCCFQSRVFTSSVFTSKEMSTLNTYISFFSADDTVHLSHVNARRMKAQTNSFTYYLYVVPVRSNSGRWEGVMRRGGNTLFESCLWVWAKRLKRDKPCESCLCPYAVAESLGGASSLRLLSKLAGLTNDTCAHLLTLYFQHIVYTLSICNSRGHPKE